MNLTKLQEIESQIALIDEKLETQKKAVRDNEQNTYIASNGRKVILMTDLIRKMEDKLSRQKKIIIRKANIPNFQFINPNTNRVNNPTIALVSNSKGTRFYEVKPSTNNDSYYGLSSNDMGYIIKKEGRQRRSAITDAVAERIAVI